ncbi:MAG TPA: translocation/assembly module TamB domain-containing protein [Chitinophagaceae bacterium]|nr:translocation/assembly module TamB domain-containing protein [Chitinophagaceae bacterium]
MAWIIGSIIFLLVLVLILIQVPAVQNFAKNKVVAYLQKKIKTKVSIDKLSISFPKEVVLKGVYFEDQKKDTLLYGREIKVDIALFKLLSHEVDVNYVEFNGIKTHINRVLPDTDFNYAYIVKAFPGSDTTTTPADTTATPMKFNIGHVVFKDILATYRDDNSGNDVYFYLGSFDTRIKTFDPASLVYKVSNIDLSGIDARVRLYKPSVEKALTAKNTATATTGSQMPTVQLGSLTLQNSKFDYKDEVLAMLANVKIGYFNTHPESINLNNPGIVLKDLALKNTTAAVIINKSGTPAKPATVADTMQSSPWNITVNKLNLNNEDIRYNNNTRPVTKKGIDYSHLHIQGLNFDADSLVFTPAVYQGKINQLAFKEQSGFSLQKLATNFYYSDTVAYLQNLYAQAGKTLLRDKIIVKYPSLNAISKNIGNLYIDAALKNSTVDVKDVLTFAPQLASNLEGDKIRLLHINTVVKGYVKNISIPVFQFNGLGNTYVNISGHVQGLPDASKAYYDINIAQLNTSAADINNLVPPGAMPASLRIPQRLSAKGYFKGNTKKIDALLRLSSTSGDAFVKGYLHNNAYTADITLTKLNVGYLTKQDSTIGVVTLTAKAKGHDFDLKKAVADIQAKVESAELKGYTYHDFTLEGTANSGVGNVKANMLDSNLKFNLVASADVTTPYPSNLDMRLQLDTADLYALHLGDTLNMHGIVTAKMPSTNPDSLIGRVSLTDMAITTSRQTLTPDSITVVADAEGEQKSLDINAEFLKAHLAGIYRFTEMGQALQQTINQYYNLPGYKDTSFMAQDWQLNASLIPTPFLLQLVAGVKGSDSIALQAKFNSAQRNLQASARSKRIIYAGSQADSLNIEINTDANKLNFLTSVQAIKTSALNTYHTTVNGFVANNKADVSLTVNDIKNKPQYNIAGVVQQVPQGIKFSLEPQGLLLNYDNWNVATDNYISYDSSGLIVNNFNISNANQLLSLNSQTKTADAPLQVKFNNFRIGTLTRMVNRDGLLLGGIINGDALVKNATTSPVFTSNLIIDSVVYKQDTIGTVTIKVNNETANAFAADVTVKGKNNDIALNGTYFTGESKMALKLDLNRLNLAAIKPFAVGQLDDAGGEMKGNISINGTTDKPVVNGNINFSNAYVVPTISGEKFTLAKEGINVDSRGIHFNNFTLLDSANNKATIDGDLLTDDFINYRFNASLNARNFTIINAQKRPNQLFYGKLNLSTRLNISGDMTAPVASGNIHINPSTDFTMILPTPDPALEEREGIVGFVDKNHPDTAVHKTIYDSLSSSSLRGIDVNANIETDSSAKLTLVIDENTGDELTMQGIANLNGGIDKSGKISLTGGYQLTHGSYEVSLSVLKRKFEIQPGSSITWTGDPTDAQVDITALYNANTAPIDLVEQQLGGSQQDLTRFKQTLPFQVILQLQGDLLKPVITFDIQLPEDLSTIYPEVTLQLQQIRQDPSELNKQVFALLLLNRFVQQDPFASSGGSTTASQLAIQSAGRILGEQLNNLAASLVKGVDINFDFNSEQDYSTGTQQTHTDVNVTVSKKLLNDRLIVNVGGNVGLQGPANNITAVQNSSISGNFSVDYKLSRDGRYRLRAYRQNDYQEIIEGQVIETGVSFILTMDYDKFKELFQGRRHRRNNKNEPANTGGIKKGIKPATGNETGTQPTNQKDNND